MKFDVAAPVQPEPPRKKQAGKQRRWANDDGGDEDRREVTPDERRVVMEVLEGEGCSVAGSMYMDDGDFEVDSVQCDDGKTYEVFLDSDYHITYKVADE